MLYVSATSVDYYFKAEKGRWGFTIAWNRLELHIAVGKGRYAEVTAAL